MTMNTNMNMNMNKQVLQDQDKKKKPYKSPALMSLGTVADITKAGTGSGVESGPPPTNCSQDPHRKTCF